MYDLGSLSSIAMVFHFETHDLGSVFKFQRILGAIFLGARSGSKKNDTTSLKLWKNSQVETVQLEKNTPLVVGVLKFT